MDAQRLGCLAVAISLISACGTVQATTYQTVNFSVVADRPEVAEEVGKAAEVYRQQLAIFWLGKPLPNWSRPCKITVNEGALGAGGQTTFQFVRGEVLNWRMKVFGTMERILDSVLPHEINHTIFACHFRRPLPRWADEGAATLFEHRSEQLKQLSLLNEVVRDKDEFISLRELLTMKEYPRGQRPMLTLYAQGYALADFLVQQKGRHAYLKFIADGERGGWEDAIRTNFDHEGIESLERNWRGWVLAGMPKLTLPRDQMLAASADAQAAQTQAASRPETLHALESQSAPGSSPRSLENATIRLQSPDPSRKNRTPAMALDENTAKVIDRVSVPQTTAFPTGEPDRRASFTAPAPRRANNSSVKTTADASPDNSSAIHESSSQQQTDKDLNESPRFSQSDEDRLFGSSTDRRGLELTAAEASGNDTIETISTRNQSSGANNSVHSRERSESYGRTPQWAGFPGQEKLF